MKKLLAFACAGSVLALSSGAFAAGPNTTYNLTVSGTISPFCDITTGSSGTYSFPAGTGATYFDNGVGGVTGNISGDVQLSVSANNKCKFSVSSSNGGLVGSGSNKTLLSYQASLGVNTVNTSYQTVIKNDNPLIDNPTAVIMLLGANTLHVGINSVATLPGAVVPADTYSDVLQITVTAS